MRNNRFNQKKEELHKINNNIRAREVRLVGDNVEQGVYSIGEALRLADELELDLVEISPTAEPPVCRITDYQKFLYQQKKKQKEAKAKSVKVVDGGKKLEITGCKGPFCRTATWVRH